VLTGGPGAGKTAVLELLAHEVCRHVYIATESAGILFSGGFPRGHDAAVRRAAQRAIYHVQVEIEAMLADANAAVILFDRGVVDGSAYWPGPGDFWTEVGTTREQAIARYDVVVHMRSPDGPNGYGHQNPLRTETPAEARAIDERIRAAWDGHPHRYIVEPTPDFFTKAEQTLTLIRAQIPECCGGPAPNRAPAEPDPRSIPPPVR
jgi:predicted ATPase